MVTTSFVLQGAGAGIKDPPGNVRSRATITGSNPVPRRPRRWVGLIGVLFPCLMVVISRGAGAGADTVPAWVAPLSAMALPESPGVTRSNAIRTIVRGFGSNTVVRALVVLPGLVDDFHLIHRDSPLAPIRARNLAEALMALTNATELRVTFEPGAGRLILHTDSDRIAASTRLTAPEAGTQLRRRRSLPEVTWVDRPWSAVQPILRHSVARGIQPPADAPEAGHFERVNLVAHGLNDAELLETIALATGTRLIIERRRIRFER